MGLPIIKSMVKASTLAGLGYLHYWVLATFCLLKPTNISLAARV